MVPAPAAPLPLEVSAPDAVAEADRAQEPPVSRAVITLPHPPPAPLVSDSSAPSAILDHAFVELDQLREDLQGANPCLAAGLLELISGWVHSDTSVRAALDQAAAASEEKKLAATQAAMARDVALKDVVAA